MLRSKSTVFGLIAAMLVMTVVFTATSSDGTSAVTAGGHDAFIVVNGEGVSETEFDARVATVEQNVVRLIAQAEAAPEGAALAESMLEIMTNTPAETIALASVILDLSLYQEAVARGHQPDPEPIARQVEQEREMFEMIEADPEHFGVPETEVERYRDRVDEIGEDAYWNEYLPQLIEQQQAVGQFQSLVDQSDWFDIQRSVFFEASVEFADAGAVAPATVDAAGEYLDSVWTVYLEESVGS